jgi:phosphatidate cytidylyltransferase
MLKQRIITALALLAILLPALFADSPQPFLILSIVLIAAGSWEWGRMNGLNSFQSILSGLLCAVLCGFAWWAHWTVESPAWVWWLAGSSWGGANRLDVATWR